MKRLFDIIFALFVLICFLPIGMILSLWITFESTGGIFFAQNRVGKNGVSFRLLKFRSMYVNAESQGRITVGSRDARITKAGYYLRKYKLDELPQLLDVWLGQMSLVGPRPEVPSYVACYPADVRDVVRAYRLLADRRVTGTVVNVGSQQLNSLQEVLEKCVRLTGHEMQVQVNPAFVRANEVKTLCADTSRLEALIGDRPLTPWDETLHWMLHDGV